MGWIPVSGPSPLSHTCRWPTCPVYDAEQILVAKYRLKNLIGTYTLRDSQHFLSADALQEGRAAQPRCLTQTQAQLARSEVPNAKIAYVLPVRSEPNA